MFDYLPFVIRNIHQNNDDVFDAMHFVDHI